MATAPFSQMVLYLKTMNSKSSEGNVNFQRSRKGNLKVKLSTSGVLQLRGYWLINN